MLRNIVGQVVAFEMNTSAGVAVTSGTPTVYVTIDGGTQAAGSGSAFHEGNGQWTYFPTQAETDGGHICYLMVLATAVNNNQNVWPYSQLADEVLSGSNHNVPTSWGRRVRQLAGGGYEGGAIWYDNLNGAPGDVVDENGTVDVPVNNMTDLLSLVTQTGRYKIQVAPNATLTLDAAFDNFVVDGWSWTLVLGNQSTSGTTFIGAIRGVSGICTGAVEPNFVRCKINDITVPPSHFRGCDYAGTITCGSAGDFHSEFGHSTIGGLGAPVWDYGAAVGATSWNFRHHSGGIQAENMAAGDIMSLEGWGQLIEGTCTAGLAVIRGDFTVANITNITLSDLARFDKNSVADVYLDRDMAAGPDTGTGIKRTPRQALRTMRNRVNVTDPGNLLEVYKEDDLTISWTGVVIKAPGDPIISVDPDNA